MATLDNKSVKATLTAVVKYNDNPDKNRPADGLYAAAAYIRGDHSVERLYSRGHNGCSSNPDLAVQQFRASEALYRKKKGGAKEAGMGRYEMDPEKYSKKFKVPMDQIELNENGKVWVEKQSTIAEHLFLSFPPEENVPYNIQCEIADKLCASTVLSDFYALSNRHYNTDNDHSHILVSNFSRDGSRKLALNNQKRNELRKELDRICVSYGYSVIDDPALRWEDPEREAFIRQLVEEQKVKVYVPADFERLYENYKKKTGKRREYDEWMLKQIRAGRVTVAEGISKNREWDEEEQRYHSVSQAEAYKKWIAEQDAFIREKDKAAAKKAKAVLISEEETKKKVARAYYWEQQYKSSKNGKYYAVRRYDDNGYHKPLLVLIVELMFAVNYNEEPRYREKYPNATKANFGGTDWSIQKKLDMLHYQDEQCVRTPDEVAQKIQAVGTDLSEARRGLSYYKSTIDKGEDLHRAVQAFRELDSKEDRTEEEDMVRTEAYRIMAAHKCTTPVEIGDFYKRREFAEKKVKDLDEQVKSLKKDYHDLKFIESNSAKIRYELERMIFANEGTHGLDDIINSAKPRQNAENQHFEEKEKIF